MSHPSSIGRYEIQRVLGYGAMGVVYLGNDPLLHRPVAIKAMRDLGSAHGEDRQNTRERFRREAEISAKLNHPNVITIFDVGEDPKVGPYMAMEFINGRSLAQLIRDGLPLESGLSLLLQGMGALKAAEDAGVVHRDIKPENVLVGADGRFKLMDFGIARRGESKLTQAGMVFGTPSYTAPELLVGAEANPGTDRYAFAVTAFEVLTRQVPFHGTSIGTTLYKIVHDPPQLPEDMDPPLKKVFARAFAKRAEDRYPDLQSFMGDLVAAAPIPDEVKLRFLHQLQEERGPLDTKVYPPTFLAQRHSLAMAAGGQTDPGLAGRAEDAAPEAPPEVPRAAGATASRLKWGLAVAAVALVGGLSALLVLLARPRTLDLFSEPMGAEVLVDGVSLGATPIARAAIPKGARLLRFQKTGYLPMEVPVPAKGSQVSPVLEPNPFEVRVVTDPPGADVYLNGQFVGKSPIQALRVPSRGAPEMRIHLEGHEEKRFSVDNRELFPEVILLPPLRPGR
ncbi:MAG: serine/threonine protein kinase [Acidobacteria bacterium]|nr:serine/threonine protein kinase [Acidobacteriota bacterium]